MRASPKVKRPLPACHQDGQTTEQALRHAYHLMRQRHGHQSWWPGDTPFEICVGAILTQNTSWTNVERAIKNLKSSDVLDPLKMAALPESRLAELVRPAGYFNVKARRLRSFLKVLIEQHAADLNKLFAGDTAEVRTRLLAITGIGPETADSMLLYAGGHHRFVVDAYTKRIFQRHGWWQSRVSSPAKGNSREDYDSLQQLCEGALNAGGSAEKLDYWQDYHAQLVMVGKHFCRSTQTRCEDCPLKPLLPASGPQLSVKHY